MSSAPLFSDRAEAGEQLAQLLLSLISDLQTTTDIVLPPVVYALPRGGIPVAVPVARLLNCPLDIVVAKKITTPKNPELAIGSVTSQGNVLWTRQRLLGKIQSNIRRTALQKALDKAQAQLAQLSVSCVQVNPQGKLALLVDDGIATGMTVAAASQAIKSLQPAQIWICAPVAPRGLMNWLGRWCDRLVVLETPDQFLSVSRFYTEFPQVNTEEALTYLQEHNHLPHHS
ncbi:MULTISPECIES: phosphoribosyltransferase [unclassified Coleofasciculus]|uniref:phosphoribosyltransferase n=1 Tax=unclassified Coleofasciculus TaxID=2692782 RepID=UPI00187E68D5|nr:MULTISPECIES: phosphoribosyltransferase family protein [unclassified Coleofasciculus]MBE9129164.1 phosphoribosyltransferase [Coleofasciculus sp. LEGE 07081]MBE9151825.1 phosphoribosyltransferase [Coleofasciculus sp. LEGE 07092]